MGTITVRTDERLSAVDITEQVRAEVPADATGTVTVFSRHTTAGVTVNEGERRLLGDFEHALDELIPNSGWAHDEIDDNADSHLRATLIGPSETVPVRDGDLQLGTWQSIILIECDGPRSRTIDIVGTD
ncbi:MAG: secondary thiamine-phosphate synthase enzyme YjbQ [Halodesulfurarchaeum sp.]